MLGYDETPGIMRSKCVNDMRELEVRLTHLANLIKVVHGAGRCRSNGGDWRGRVTYKVVQGFSDVLKTKGAFPALVSSSRAAFNVSPLSANSSSLWTSSGLKDKPKIKAAFAPRLCVWVVPYMTSRSKGTEGFFLQNRERAAITAVSADSEAVLCYIPVESELVASLFGERVE
jgi:hypothetical protein